MTAAIASLNHLSTVCAEALWRASWQGAIALLAALLISRLLPRVAPPLRAWLWRLAFLKLLLGLVSLPPIVLPILPPAAVPVVTATPAAAPSAIVQPIAATAPPAAPAAAPAPPAAPVVRVIPLARLLGAWVLTILAYAWHLARCWRRARRLRRACRPVRAEALTTALAELCRRARVRPHALLIGQVATPLLLGLLRPAIILPEALSSTGDDPHLRLVLAHEVAHLRRRDLLWNWLPLLAQGLFLFHPLVWVARREWAVAQEMACDAEALTLTAASEAEYGDMLVRVALPRQTLRTHPLAAGIAEPYHTLRRRLRALAHFTPLTRRRLLAGGLALAVLGLFALVPWEAAAREAKAARRAAPAPSVVRTILTIPYGSGAGQVGRLYHPEEGFPPIRIIQQTRDGAIWVEDVANGRVLAFQDGKPIESIALPGRGGGRGSFAVTPQAVFVVEGGHEKRLTRYDRARHSATTVVLRLPDGEGTMPMWVAPLGARNEAVLVAGMGGPGSVFRVEGDGRLGVVAEMKTTSLGSLPIPAADGGLWRFRLTRGVTARDIQGVIERYDAGRRRWAQVAPAALPQPAESDDGASAVGMDEHGNSLFAISAGPPDLTRFVRVDRRGKVLATFALRDLGLDPQLDDAVGGWVQCQLLPDGDLLLLTAVPEGYRVLRVRLPATSPKPAPVPLSQLVPQFVTRFTRDFYSSAVIRSDADVSGPMLEAAHAHRDSIDSILGQCRNVSAADAVAAQLLAPLEAHARNFRPGSKINERLLREPALLNFDEFSGRSLPADAYLLLALAKQRQSPALTRRALIAVADAAAADSYLWQQRDLRVLPKETAREVREARLYLTPTVGALAWCAESFLVDTSRARPSFLPPAARQELDAYLTWRRAALAKGLSRDGWLSFSQAYSTLTYARRVAEKLPN